MNMSPSQATPLSAQLFGNSSTSANNQTTAGIMGSAQSWSALPNTTVAYASIAPAVFVVLVLVAIYVRQRNKSKRVLEAGMNLRSEGMVEEGTGRKLVMHIPLSPRTRTRDTDGSVEGEMSEAGRAEIQQVHHDHDLDVITPASPRTNYHHTAALSDSDIYSPRYTPPSSYSTPTTPKATAPLREARSISPETLPSTTFEQTRPESQITPPPKLPPGPSSVTGASSNWRANSYSPSQSHLYPDTDMQTPVTMERRLERKVSASTPFHMNYKRPSMSRQGSAEIGGLEGR
jgi:hypothetical protein